MRSIDEIKESMTADFMRNETLAELYGFNVGEPFSEHFSKLSVESILFFVVATTQWTLEKLFATHVEETTDLLHQLKPHTRMWYANKAKAFQYGGRRIPDTDQYDNSDIEEKDIEKQRKVKYAAVEDKEGVVYVKVAGGSAGARTPIEGEELVALESYLNEVKDAGVKLVIHNKEANHFGIRMDVYYNPQVFDSNLNRLDGGGKTVHQAIRSFVENLPFNGEYQNSALIKMLLDLEGVVLVELKGSTCDNVPIDAKIVPDAGYFKVDNEDTDIVLKAQAYGVADSNK
jgi:hypothetical protein